MISMTVCAVNLFDYNLSGLLDLVYVITLAYSVMCIHMNLICQKSRIVQFIENLEIVVTARAGISQEITAVYEKADTYTEKLSKYSIAFTAAGAAVFVSQWAIKSLWIILSKNHCAYELTLFYPLAYVFATHFLILFKLNNFFSLSLPYDWRKPFGFIVTTFILLTLISCFVTLFLSFLLIYIGVCKFIVALSQDIQWHLKAFEDEIMVIEKPTSLEKHLEVKMKLNKTIEFHSKSLR